MRFRHPTYHPDLHDLVQGYWELEDLHLASPAQSTDLPEGTIRLMFSAETVLTGVGTVALRTLPPVPLVHFSSHPQENVMQGRFRILVAERLCCFK